MATLVLTVLGDDRPGLVSALSAPIKAHGASWERSQMARLAGKFAGIVLVTVPEERVEPLLAALAPLEADGLQITCERTDVPVQAAPARLTLDLVGADHPGIVADISALLADHGISIEELSTDVREAPMAGGMLFEAHAVLSAPAEVPHARLRTALEALADELMVEIGLSDD